MRCAGSHMKCERSQGRKLKLRKRWLRCAWAQAGEGVAEVAVAPVTIALVDASGSEEWLELVRSALAAALEALPGTSLFGLVTFGTQVRASFQTYPTSPYPTFITTASC